MDKKPLPFGFGGVSIRTPYASEDTFFKGSPHVAGMATEDNKIALNPYSRLTPEQRDAVARNEAARVWMRRSEWAPPQQLTNEQAAKFANYGAPKDQAATIIARLISGDASSGDPTQTQLEFAQRLAAAMAKVDWEER